MATKQLSNRLITGSSGREYALCAKSDNEGKYPAFACEILSRLNANSTNANNTFETGAVLN